MECFNGALTSQYFSAMNKQLEDEIDKLEAKDIDNTSPEEWLDYFISKYEIVPVELYADDVEYDLSETKVRSYNTFAINLPYGQEYIEIPGVHATCKVLYSGDKRLFELTPSIHTLDIFEVDSIGRLSKDGYGVITLSEDISQSTATADGVKAQFAQRIAAIEKEVDRCNKDLEGYNAGLEGRIKKRLDRRCGQLDKIASLKQGLNIPLKRVQDAPMAKPIPLAKKKLLPRKPKATTSNSAIYSISDSDYSYITEVIDNCGSAMEVTPKSFEALGEEDLRNHILTVLNTHFDNATGETFRNHGKTDIFIPIEEHAAYIAECKLWHGRKAFVNAINQLFSYTTWRDTKVTIVIFNKDNKAFERVLEEVEAYLWENSYNVKKLKTGCWTCDIEDSITERRMHLTVQVFDLHV